MRELIRAVVQNLEAGKDVQLVSVVESVGSVPRGAGAMMAVLYDGTICGSVGGGNVEYEACRLAGSLLKTGGNALRQFRFVQGDAASVDMVCGGDVTLHFQHLPAGDETALALFRALARAAEENTSLWLARKLEGEQVTAMQAVTRESAETAGVPAELAGEKACFRDGWFVQPLVKAGRVYVFGGGHVSQALVPLMAAVGFRPVVYDDRPEFASTALFPRAEAVLCGSFEEIAGQVRLTADDYVVVMTRGHQADYEVLTQTLRSGVKYLGCIGSRKKLALCKERLLAAGFTEEEYARVHAPIGLAIGAETPAEIALSVAAELVAVRAGMKR